MKKNFNRVTILNSEQKLNIELIVVNILNSGNLDGIDSINALSKILYFIDISFIKMMAPHFKDEILAHL